MGPMFVACSSVPCDPGFQLTMFGSTKRRRVVPLTICWLRSVEALRSPPNFRSWAAEPNTSAMDPLIKEPGQADIRKPVPASRVPFYLRDTRRWMLAPVPPGSVVMLAMDSPSGAMKRPKVGPPTTVRLPVQSALTE